MASLESRLPLYLPSAAHILPRLLTSIRISFHFQLLSTEAQIE